MCIHLCLAGIARLVLVRPGKGLKEKRHFKKLAQEKAEARQVQEEKAETRPVKEDEAAIQGEDELDEFRRQFTEEERLEREQRQRDALEEGVERARSLCNDLLLWIEGVNDSAKRHETRSLRLESPTSPPLPGRQGGARQGRRILWWRLALEAVREELETERQCPRGALRDIVRQEAQAIAVAAELRGQWGEDLAMGQELLEIIQSSSAEARHLAGHLRGNIRTSVQSSQERRLEGKESPKRVRFSDGEEVIAPSSAA